MSKQRKKQVAPEHTPMRQAEQHDEQADAQKAIGTSLNSEATLLTKTNDIYRGGVAQRGLMARNIQRRQGNRHAQKIIDRARQSGEQYQASAAHSALPLRGARVQRDMTDTLPTSFGEFKMNMITKNEAAKGGRTGLDGNIQFHPKIGAPYSNKIGLIQIVKLTDTGGTNVEPSSLPKAHGPHLRTAEDKAAGVEKGFFTDVLHNDFGNTNKDAPQHSPLPPHYAGGTPIFGFKRSDNPADIKLAELQDFPSTSGTSGGLKFSFETVARGDDTVQSYGSVKWAFEIKDGLVTSETAPTVTDNPSATWEAAMDKHRDFYTHEPVTFYFEFDSRVVNGTENTKVTAVRDYLLRPGNSDVQLHLEGRADLIGNAAYNRQLSADRIAAVRQALIDGGVDAARINASAPVDARGATDDQTQDAITPQLDEANRRGNRSVIVTFVRPAVAGPPAAPTTP
jgi:outer membrane protein OmpA-like peptidoglycan-associated protein